jgi:hypothetical protein
MLRERDIIDSELRLLVCLRKCLREQHAPLPSIAVIDELLDERTR